MKGLLLIPKLYTISKTFIKGLERNNCDVFHYDYREDTKGFEEKIHTHIRKFPHKIRSKWYRIYVSKINKRHLELFHKYQPDIVLVYNSEMLLPETVVEMKRSAKVCFFMGDSPFYTPTNDFYLQCLMKADCILCPDSFWVEQLKGIGLSGVHFFLLGSNPETNFPREVSNTEKETWGSDLVFVGATFSNVVGYKRALFLSKFSELDIRIYTNKMIERWYTFFPDLKKKVIYPEKRISDEDLNVILNCCKIYPVDANPGLINGIHVRIFDCIASGILPIAEYRKDVRDVFGKVGLPIIDDYNKAASIVQYYLDNELERKDIISALSKYVDEHYSPQKSIAKLLDIVIS